MTQLSLKTSLNLKFPIDAQTRASIAYEIETYYSLCPETTYLSALTEWADANDVSHDDMVKYCIAETLKQKLYHEAVRNKRLKKQYIPDTQTLDSLFG